MENKLDAIEIFDEIYDIHISKGITNQDKYTRLRIVLEKVCKDLTRYESIQFSNLFSRLSFIIERTNLDKRKKYQIHSFRITANKVLYEGLCPSENEYLTHLKGLCEVIGHFYKATVPLLLAECFPAQEYFTPKKFKTNIVLKKIRVEVVEIKDDYFICNQEFIESENNIIVRINVPGINDKYTCITGIWEGAQLNLLNVHIDEKGHFIPKLIILEPDYLIDISSIAECFQNYGYSALQFLKSKFESVPNTKYIRLGNFANSTVDTLIYEQLEEENTATSILTDDFKQYPFEYTTCNDIEDHANFNQFRNDCILHYNNLRNVIKTDFPNSNILRDRITLEPAFLCEEYKGD